MMTGYGFIFDDADEYRCFCLYFAYDFDLFIILMSFILR